MMSSQRLVRFSALIVLAGVVSGCVVLPFGKGHGRYGRGDGHYEPPRDSHRDSGDRRGDRPRRGR